MIRSIFISFSNLLFKNSLDYLIVAASNANQPLSQELKAGGKRSDVPFSMDTLRQWVQIWLNPISAGFPRQEAIAAVVVKRQCWVTTALKKLIDRIQRQPRKSTIG